MRNLNVAFYDINEFMENNNPFALDRAYNALTEKEINKLVRESEIFEKEINSEFIIKNNLFKYLVLESLTRNWIDNMSVIEYNKYMEKRVNMDILGRFDLNSLLFLNIVDQLEVDSFIGEPKYNFLDKDKFIQDFVSIMFLINDYLDSSIINSDDEFLSYMVEDVCNKIRKRLKL